ncbi:MAG: GTP-binding protein, partial [Oscillospiraceae bacterium]|nr:GTP-binding protein [Oscillospiraceae bacterium]
MKRLTIGMLAHVDSGKTTLSEAMLYLSGAVRRLGRVDHGDAFLDTDQQERERGITIFSKQARLEWKGCGLTLLDTPGHVDFSAEMERAVQVLDYAVLLVSGADGVQGHTETLWRLLKRHRVPTFLFINKMDQPGADREGLLAQLRERLDEGCADFSGPREGLLEQAALCDEELMERYLETGELSDADLSALIVERGLFPCFFGSALKVEGVAELLDGLDRYTLEPDWPSGFAARVFKISRDEKGERLTWLKVTGGVLKVRDTVKGPDWE